MGRRCAPWAAALCGVDAAGTLLLAGRQDVSYRVLTETRQRRGCTKKECMRKTQGRWDGWRLAGVYPEADSRESCGLAPRDAHETADLGRAPRASRRSAVGRRCRAARSWRGRWTSGRASRGRVCCPHTAVNGRRRAVFRYHGYERWFRPLRKEHACGFSSISQVAAVLVTALATVATPSGQVQVEKWRQVEKSMNFGRAGP